MGWWSGDEDLLLNHQDLLACGVVKGILAFLGESADCNSSGGGCCGCLFRAKPATEIEAIADALLPRLQQPTPEIATTEPPIAPSPTPNQQPPTGVLQIGNGSAEQATGNVSPTLSASTRDRPITSRPASANYTLPCATVAQGGGYKQSASYVVRDVIGQMNGGNTQSQSYRISSGFWGCANSYESVPTAVQFVTFAKVRQSNLMIVALFAVVISGWLIVNRQ